MLAMSHFEVSYDLRCEKKGKTGRLASLETEGKMSILLGLISKKLKYAYYYKRRTYCNCNDIGDVIPASG